MPDFHDVVSTGIMTCMFCAFTIVASFICFGWSRMVKEICGIELCCWCIAAHKYIKKR